MLFAGKMSHCTPADPMLEIGMTEQVAWRRRTTPIPHENIKIHRSLRECSQYLPG